MFNNSIKTMVSGGHLKKADIKGFKGFTLAEVLITLVIIGVIAAMTIPTLMNNTNKQEYVSRLKKTYSTMAQTTKMIISDEGNPKGSIGGWANSRDNIFNLYKKYISNSGECNSASGCLKGTYRYKNDTVWNFNHNDFRTLVLSDGAEISIKDNSLNQNCTTRGSGTDNFCQHILIDVNGDKKPNTVGQDTFAFSLTENGLVPTGCDYDDCTSASSLGWGCTCKVLREGAINY